MAEAELTSGYCVRCGKDGRGRFRWMINGYAAAIDDHIGCPFSTKPHAPPVGWQHEVSGLNGMPGLVIPGPLDEPRGDAASQPDDIGLGSRQVVQTRSSDAPGPADSPSAGPPTGDEVTGPQVGI